MALAAPIVAAPALARAVVYPCTEAGVTSALAAGGVATFSCAAPTTIVVSSTRTVSVSGTDLDGGGRLILSGGGVRQVLAVPAGVTATLRNLVVERGISGASMYGGCLTAAGTLTVNDSTLRGCTAAAGASAVYAAAGGTLRMNRCTVSGNTGGVEGAVGVHGTAVLTNTTISDNHHRGVVARFGGNATLNHCTVVTVGEPTFAVLPGDTVTATHSLLVSSAPACGGTGTFASMGYNMLSNATGVTITGDTTGNQLNVAPLLGPLADNGGPALTRALLACSPGINAGATSAGPATDQRGLSRLVNGARDIGAVESSLAPCVSINDVSRPEGNTGSANAVFTVTLSGAATVATSVGYASEDGTASTTDADYGAVAGTLAFAPGVTSRTVALPVLGDTRFEPDETFTLRLSAPVNASLIDSTATGTIADDDRAPVLAVSDVRVTEGDTGTTNAVFAVTLSNPSSMPVAVDYATADGTAAAGSDYTAASGRLTFAPGVVTQNVTVVVTGDATFEPDEAFRVALGAPSGATIADGTGVGTIANDDAVPSVSVSDARVVEGNAGTASLIFDVALSNPRSAPASVAYSTGELTATAADGDFDDASGVLTFAPGVTRQTVTVVVRGDTRLEADETLQLVLSAPSGVTLGDATGVGTIANDDGMPALSIDDVTVAEGDSGTTDAAFTVRLSAASGLPVTVRYATMDATAVAGSDFASAMGTLTFAPGETSQAVAVTVAGDTRVEADETFVVRLSNATGATIATAEGTATITNDDTTPPPPDAGVDAGVDAAVDVLVARDAVVDAPRADASADAGSPPSATGCGCTTAGRPRATTWGAGALFVLAAALGARRRRGARSPE